MTKNEVLKELDKMLEGPQVWENAIGNFVISWSRDGHYDFRHGNTSIACGKIPASADRNAYPIRMAIEAVANMNI